MSEAPSQDRLTRESDSLPPAPRIKRLPDAYPPEDYRTLAAEYPWLAVAAGAGLGLLVGAVVPKRVTAGIGKRVLGAAGAAGRLGLTIAAQARDKAVPAQTEPAAHEPSSAAAPAPRAGLSALVLAREAIRLAARLRK